MNLLDEIERGKSWHAIDVKMSALWPRIKAALEAAQDMDELLSRNNINHASQSKFREAFEETDTRGNRKDND